MVWEWRLACENVGHPSSKTRVVQVSWTGRTASPANRQVGDAKVTGSLHLGREGHLLFIDLPKTEWPLAGFVVDMLFS